MEPYSHAARLYFDEDADARLAQALRQRGYDVKTTVDAGVLEAADEEQWAYAASQQRALVTSPLDACQQNRANVIDPETSEITPADALCIFQRFLGLSSCLDALGHPERLEALRGNNVRAVARTPQPLVVRVSDALSNLVAAIPVMFRLLSEGGGDMSESVVSTDASGEATTMLTVEEDAIPPRAEASVTALEQPLVFTITGIVNDDIQIEISGNTQVAAPGETLLEPLVVRVEDAFDNPVPGVEVAATITQGVAEFVTPVSTLAVSRSLVLRQTQTGGETTAVAVTDANGEARFLLRVLDSQENIRTQVTIANQTVEFTTLVTEVRAYDPLARPMTIFVQNIINCEINPMLGDNLFQFSGTARDTVVLTLTRVDGGLVQAELFGPDQQRLTTCGPIVFDASQRLPLPLTGTYTLRVTEAGNNETVSYGLALDSLFPQ